MIKVIQLSFAVFTLLIANPVVAQYISTRSDREDSIEGITRVLQAKEAEAFDASTVENPFVEQRDEPQPVQVAQPREEIREAPVQPATAPVLPDDVALSAIARSFSPQGSLILGNRGILQLGGGRSLEIGDRFNATIQGRSYEVLIENVTTSGYTLRLGSATYQGRFAGSAQGNP